MNLFAKIALAGIGTAALAGSALAADRAMHLLDVNLPDGSVAHVRYFGDVAPKVVLVPIAQAEPVAMLDPFAEIFADMDRQQEAMLQHVAAMQRATPQNGKIDEAALKTMPAGGTVSYSFTSYSNDGGCTQSYQMTSYGANAQPKVVSQSSGDCSKAPKFGAAPTPVKAPAPEPKTVPHDAV